MRRFDRLVAALESRRAANAGGGVIRASVPEGQGSAMRPRCGAVAGMSLHAPMT